MELRVSAPRLPLRVFRNRQFLGVSVTTLPVSAALNGLLFLLMVQRDHADAVARAGRAAQQVGPRIPTVCGTLIAALGMLPFGRVQPGGTYATSVLPAASVFAVGLAWFVAPLTTVAQASLGEQMAELASGVNNRLLDSRASSAPPSFRWPRDWADRVRFEVSR